MTEPEPGGAVPPYEGRRTEGDPDEMTHRARTGDEAVGDDPGVEVGHTPGVPTGEDGGA